MAKIFNFFLDEKVTSWKRTEFQIEAKTKKDAIKNAVDFVKNGDANNIGWDDLENTTERMDVDENGGCSTIELHETESFKIIYHN